MSKVRFRFKKAGRYAETDVAASQIQVARDGDEAYLTPGRAKELEELGRGEIIPDEPEGDEPEGDEPEGDEPEGESAPVPAPGSKRVLRRRKSRA